MNYAKLIAAVIGAGLAAAVAAFTDNVVTPVEKINIAIAVVGAAAVFAAPNVPGAMYTKSILAVLSAVLVFLTSAITDGVSTSEWLQVGVISLTALGVFAVPNSTSEVRSSALRCIGVPLLLCSLVLSQFGCGGDGKPASKDFIRYSRETVSLLRDVVPILNANHISTITIEKSINVGDRLVTAFENNDNANALLLTADLITAFEAAEGEYLLLKDGSAKTLILVGTALAKVALRHLANLVDDTLAAADHYRVSVPGVTSFQSSSQQSQADQAKEKIRAFKKKKQSRCKNAVTGRFEKLEFCKANPSTSYVVTFAR